MIIELQNEVALAEKIAKPRAGDCPYTLFLGAGASVSSGIPSTEGFIKIWKRSLYKELVDNRVEIDEDKYNHWETHGYKDWFKENVERKGDTEYSILFNHFFHEPKERQLFIQSI
jgi:NAD-dependent SIR2 family protein deacetylase